MCSFVGWPSLSTLKYVRVYSLSNSYDCSRLIKLKFIGDCFSWPTKFATPPHSVAIAIDRLKFTCAAFLSLGWNPCSINHIILSALAIDSMFNVVKYIGQAPYAHLLYYYVIPEGIFLCTVADDVGRRDEFI